MVTAGSSGSTRSVAGDLHYGSFFHQKSLLSVQQQICAELENRVEEGVSLSPGSVQGRVLLLGTLRQRQVKHDNVCALHGGSFVEWVWIAEAAHYV